MLRRRLHNCVRPTSWLESYLSCVLQAGLVLYYTHVGGGQVGEPLDRWSWLQAVGFAVFAAGGLRSSCVTVSRFTPIDGAYLQCRTVRVLRVMHAAAAKGLHLTATH